MKDPIGRGRAPHPLGEDRSEWVMGTCGLLETAEALRAYALQDVARRIEGDVLILAGENDHFVPVEQVKPPRPAALRPSSTTANPAVPNIVNSAPSRSGMQIYSIG